MNSQPIIPRPVRFGVLCLTLLALNFGHAQDYQIHTSSFTGGGSSAGGGFHLTGNFEWTPASQLGGGGYSLQSGFLAGVIVQQTPGGPRITITHVGTDIVLTWTTSEAGWVLESSAAVAAPTAAWGTTSESVEQTDDTRTVTLTAPTGIRFYRLKKLPAE